MRHLSFDDLWENHLFEYKDGDLLVIDDIMRLRLSDYLHTTLAFIMVAFCWKGDVRVVIDEHEYLLVEGSLLVYLPGQMLGEIRPIPDAQVKLIAFAQRAIDRFTSTNMCGNVFRTSRTTRCSLLTGESVRWPATTTV